MRPCKTSLWQMYHEKDHCQMLLPSCSNDKGGGLESDQSDQSVEGPNQPTKVEVRAPVSRYIPEIEKTTKRILTSLQCLEPIIDYGK